MGREIKRYHDGSYLEYDRGNFDYWCVYLSRPGRERKPLKDVEYFEKLKEYGAKYGTRRLYLDYVKIYDMTGKKIERKVLEEISSIASGYPEDRLPLDIILTTLYMAMIAEENKAYTKLGKGLSAWVFINFL